MSKVATIKGPGIKWIERGKSPEGGLGLIVSTLKNRYNPTTHDVHFMLDVPTSIPKIKNGSKIILGVQREDDKEIYEDFGSIDITYIGKPPYESVGGYKIDQPFLVYFKMGKESYRERDSILNL